MRFRVILWFRRDGAVSSTALTKSVRKTLTRRLWGDNGPHNNTIQSNHPSTHMKQASRNAVTLQREVGLQGRKRNPQPPLCNPGDHEPPYHSTGGGRAMASKSQLGEVFDFPLFLAVESRSAVCQRAFVHTRSVWRQTCPHPWNPQKGVPDCSEQRF